MRKSLAVLAASSFVAAGAIAGAVPADAAAPACGTPASIVSTTISPTTVVLGIADPKGIVITTKLRTNGCRVDRVELGLYGPNFIDSYDLGKVGTSNGVTTYDTGLRITPGDLPNSEAGTWSSYVSVWGESQPNAAGPHFRILRTTGLTADASPEPVNRGTTITVRGKLTRANWETKTYQGYGQRAVELQWRSATGTYQTVKTVTTDANGDLRTTVKASQDGCFRYVFKGSVTTAAKTSTADCVDVR